MQADFFKSYFVDTNFMYSDMIDFEVRVNESTGEAKNGTIAKYSELDLKRFDSGRNSVSGSIHKFWNKCDFNGNDFNIFHLFVAVERLYNELGIHPRELTLENLEINITIQLPFSPNNILKNLLFHGASKFAQPNSKSYYSQCEKTEYTVKIYNKTDHYNWLKRETNRSLAGNTLSAKERIAKEFLRDKIESELKPNLLRFEVKFTRMNTLNKVGVFNVFDLLNSKLYPSIREIVLDMFDEVYFYDYTMNTEKMKTSELSLIKDLRNPNYWLGLSKSQRYEKKKRFNELTSKYSQNTKCKIRELLDLKFTELTFHYKDFVQHIYENDFRLFERSNISSDSQKTCVITGEDISCQQEGRPYLKKSGLWQLYHNRPKRFWQLWHSHRNTLSKRYADTIEDKVIVLGRAIKKRFYNPRYNPIAIQKNNYHPNQQQFNFM